VGVKYGKIEKKTAKNARIKLHSYIILEANVSHINAASCNSEARKIYGLAAWSGTRLRIIELQF
jgi:hypothetical protein